MPSFIHYLVVLMILCQYIDEIWSSNIHKQEYYGLESFASSEEESNIRFNSNDGQYYNSREAHGDSLDIVDGKNVTGEYYGFARPASSRFARPASSGFAQPASSGFARPASSSDTDSLKYVLDVDSLESKEDLTDNVNTKSVYEQNFSTESKEVYSHETFGSYSSDTDSVKYVELGSAESSETTESWALLRQGQTRIIPLVPQDFPSPEVSLPQCRGSKKGNKEKQCRKEQNLCRSTGDCRIARIRGTCCNSPGCGTYCQPNKSKCPHPNSINVACNIKSDVLCSPLRGDCLRGTSCCQTPCGYRCV